MCCFLQCCTLALDFIQRVITVLLAMMICLVVCLGLVTAVAAGIAYGYNYSMSEFLTYKRQNMSVYMRRGLFHGKPQMDRERPLRRAASSGGGNSDSGGGNSDSGGGNNNPESGNNNPESGNTTPEGEITNPESGNEPDFFLRRSNDDINSIMAEDVYFSSVPDAAAAVTIAVSMSAIAHAHKSKTWPWVTEDFLGKQYTSWFKKLLSEDTVPHRTTLPISLIEDIMRTITTSTKEGTVTKTPQTELAYESPSPEKLQDINQLVNVKPTSPKSELFWETAADVDKKGLDKIKIKVPDDYDFGEETALRTNVFYSETLQPLLPTLVHKEFYKRSRINGLGEAEPLPRTADFGKIQQKKKVEKYPQHNTHSMRYWDSQQTSGDDDVTKDDYEEEYGFKPV